MIYDRSLVLVGAVVALATGCTQHSGGGSGGGAAGPELPALSTVPEAAGPVRAKPGFKNAQQLSDSVKVGVPQRVVEAMFGPPDKAGYKIYGRAAGTPWRALVWEWVFQDVNPPRALSIVFQEDGSGTWRVNHGDWPE
jgi:hypothetical protein